MCLIASSLDSDQRESIAGSFQTSRSEGRGRNRIADLGDDLVCTERFLVELSQ
jgi:hypothetical protein